MINIEFSNKENPLEFPQEFDQKLVLETFRDRYSDVFMSLDPRVGWEILGIDIKIFENLSNADVPDNIKSLSYNVLLVLKDLKVLGNGTVAERICDSGYEYGKSLLLEGRGRDAWLGRFAAWREQTPFLLANDPKEKDRQIELLSTVDPIDKFWQDVDRPSYFAEFPV